MTNKHFRTRAETEEPRRVRDQSRGWAQTDESGEPAGTGESGILRRGNQGHGAVGGVEGQIRKGQGNRGKAGFLVQCRSK